MLTPPRDHPEDRKPDPAHPVSSGPASPRPAATAPPPYILAFGDSLTAGYGLALADSFPAQLQSLLRDRHPGAEVRNAGVSGDTSASARRRLPRLLSSLKRLPDLAVMELGANDLLQGVPPQQTRLNLDAMLDDFERCGIPVLIATMEPPRFLGNYAQSHDTIYADLASKHRLPSWPFFPPGVMGNPALTLPDRLHPNARAIAMIARHMLPGVLDALPKRQPASPSAAQED